MIPLRDLTANRRQAIGLVAGATIAGGLWGAAFTHLLRSGGPALAIVGNNNSMLALATAERTTALIAIGEPLPELTAALPAMLTLVRRRIDAFVGEPDLLTALLPEIDNRFDVGMIVAVHHTADSPAFALPTQVVSDATRLTIDERLDIDIVVSHVGEWRGEAPTSLTWRATVTCDGVSALVCPWLAEETVKADPPPALLVVPHLPNRTLFEHWRPAAIAVNASELEDGVDLPADITLVRIFGEDVARFRFTTSGMEMPDWADRSAGYLS